MLKDFKNKKVILISLLLIVVLGLILCSSPFSLAADPSPAPAPAAPAAPAPAAPTIFGGVVSSAASGVLGLFVMIIGTMISVLTYLVGDLLTLAMEMLVWISGYNSFINNDYVREGWKILRDLVNMFFVLGLLFIAFVTVLKVERYQWSKLLGRLLIMAVLVNFSKTICGLMIDFFQILMMTFVNAYKDITAGNIMNAVSMTSWFQLSLEMAKQTFGSTKGGDPGTQAYLLASTILGLILAIVLLIITCVLIIILAIRIVALWVLVVFSPLAFFAWVFESGGGKIGEFSKTWWTQFLNYCMIGPFLAFFLWISILTMAKLDPANMVSSDYYNGAKRQSISATLSRVGSMDNIIKFMMTIVMMVVGLSQAQRFAVVGASYASGAANWMKDQSVGRLERGARYAGGLAAAAGKKPYELAVKPRLAGAAAGISQRLQTGRLGTIAGREIKVPPGLSKILTKAGREESIKQRQAAYEKRYAGGGLENLKTNMGIADNQEKLRPDVNWKSAPQVRQLLDDMKVKDAQGNTRDKNGKLIAWKKGIDPRLMMKATMSLADAGKLEYEDVNDLNQEGGIVAGMDKREKQVFLEGMEDRYMKETGRMKAFGSLIYNEETNQYDDMADLERNGQTSMKNNNLDDEKLADIPFSKIAKKITDKNDADYGAYKLDENAEEFKKLDAGKQQMLRDLQSKGISYDKEHPEDGSKNSDFYNVVRYNDVIEGKRGEVKKKMATSNKEQFNKASKQADFGDPTKNDIYTGVEMDGGVKQLSRVSGLDQGGRDNWVAKIGVRFTQGADRAKLIKDNKQWFNRDLQQKDGESDGDYVKRLDGWEEVDKVTGKKTIHDGVYSRMDRETSAMGEDQLKEYQDFYKESTAKYDDFGRKKEEGTGNITLDQKILKKRQKEGIASKISDKIESQIPQPSQQYAPQAKKFITAEASHMLTTTEDMDKADRIKAISQRIQSNTVLKGPEANNVAELIVENEVKIKALDKEVKAEKGRVTITLKSIIDESSKQFRGGKDTSKIGFTVNALIQRLEKRINSSAMPADSFALVELKKEIEKLKGKVESAKDQKEYDAAVKDLRNALKSLGYEVSGGEGSKKPTQL